MTSHDKLRAAGLFDIYLKESTLLNEKNYIIDHMQHYKAKFPGYSKMRPAQRRAAAAVWVFRELLGKHFNCPVGYILSKRALAASIADPEGTVASLEQELNRGRSAEKDVNRACGENLPRGFANFGKTLNTRETSYRPLHQGSF